MKIKKPVKVNTPKKLKPKSNLVVAAGAGIAFVAVAGGLYYGLSQALAQETYYILNTDVPSKSQITPSMLNKIETSKGTAPQNALTAAQVETAQVFSRYPLKAGDIVTPSNTGSLQESGVGIPDDWVRTSFVIASENTADGTIGRGDYIDILITEENGDSRYLFTNILILDTVSESESTGQDKDGRVMSLGKQKQFNIGMPADSAAVLHSALSKQAGRMKILHAPYSTKYKNRTEPYLGEKFNYANSTKATDLKAGTDSTFKPVERNEDGSPKTAQQATQQTQQASKPASNNNEKKEGN